MGHSGNGLGAAGPVPIAARSRSPAKTSAPAAAAIGPDVPGRRRRASSVAVQTDAPYEPQVFGAESDSVTPSRARRVLGSRGDIRAKTKTSAATPRRTAASVWTPRRERSRTRSPVPTVPRRPRRAPLAPPRRRAPRRRPARRRRRRRRRAPPRAAAPRATRGDARRGRRSRSIRRRDRRHRRCAVRLRRRGSRRDRRADPRRVAGGGAARPPPFSSTDDAASVVGHGEGSAGIRDPTRAGLPPRPGARRGAPINRLIGVGGDADRESVSPSKPRRVSSGAPSRRGDEEKEVSAKLSPIEAVAAEVPDRPPLRPVEARPPHVGTKGARPPSVDAKARRRPRRWRRRRRRRRRIHGSRRASRPPRPPRRRPPGTRGRPAGAWARSGLGRRTRTMEWS